MFPLDIEFSRFRTEIELAQQVQQNLLPASAPVVVGLDIFAVFRPQYLIGGDFYDFMLDQDQRFIFIVSDVCGKGLPAALVMSITRQALRIGASPLLGLSPEDIFLKTNAMLYEDFSRLASFATVFIGRYNPATRMLVYANAGHSPVIFKPAGKAASLLLADAAPIGVLPTSSSKNHYLQLSPGDLMVVGTDGLAESHSAHEVTKTEYSSLLEKTEYLADQSAQAIAEGLFHSPQNIEHASVEIDRNIQYDDQTVLVIKCK